MRLVLDTNVAVAGLLWHGVPRQLLDRSIDDETVELYSSLVLMDELANTLHYEKFAKRIALYRTNIEELVTQYQALVTLVSPTHVPRIVPEDPDDDHVLACAVTAKAEFIVSGDNHLLSLKQYRDIPIVTAAEALQRLASP